MYPVTTRFLRTLSESHVIAVEAELHRTDGVVELLPVSGGTVTVDRGSQVRRSCSFTTPDPALIPRTPADKLATYGAYVILRRGIAYADGTRELVPLGTFRLETGGGDVDFGPAAIEGKSYEQAVADHKFTAPTTNRGSATALASIELLILETLPDAVITTDLADEAIGIRTWEVGGDRWAAVQECAAALGAEVYCGPDGEFVVATLPDPLTTAPVWEVPAGEGGALIGAARSMSRDGVYNGWRASGESTESDVPPVSSLVVDDDPTSPTYWDGPFGKRPAFYSSAVLTTTPLCTAAATLKLRASVAPNSVADLSSLPNPALQPGDVIRAVYADGRPELHQLQSVSIPLDVGGSFSIATISAREEG